MRCTSLALILFVASVTTVVADLENDPFPADIDHPAIQYSTAPTTDPISLLNAKLEQGTAQLKFDDQHGYLRSVLEALKVPVESQILPFSKTSVQGYLINPNNPRSLFFNDSVIVGWVHGGKFLELASEDPKQGVIFYTLDEQQVDHPRFIRHDNCLSCHLSYSSLDVAGTLVRSIATNSDGTIARQLGDYLTDDRSPFDQRWGGWYVTGITGAMKHMGNAFANDAAPQAGSAGSETFNLVSLKAKFDTDRYLTPYSDVVALMVFEHEMHMMNLFTRVGWEVRLALYNEQTGSATHAVTQRVLTETSREVVDYMLFVDEAPLPSKIQSTSGFTEEFSVQGPKDSQGRSLRQLDLQHRLMRYACSYMIYSAAFDSLPDQAKTAIYARMWQILSGQDKDAKYTNLSLPDRKAIIEILRQTKSSLPDYFQ
jgi:hypothetical protein